MFIPFSLCVCLYDVLHFNDLFLLAGIFSGFCRQQFYVCKLVWSIWASAYLILYRHLLKNKMKQKTKNHKVHGHPPTSSRQMLHC